MKSGLLPTLSQIAETVHNARWPEDQVAHAFPFEEEDAGGREYCYRIARAIQKLYQESK